MKNNKIIISTISIWISILLNQLNFLTKVENYFFDQRVKIADPYTTSHSDIILLLIDENSLNELSPLLGAGLGLVYIMTY